MTFKRHSFFTREIFLPKNNANFVKSLFSRKHSTGPHEFTPIQISYWNSISAADKKWIAGVACGCALSYFGVGTSFFGFDVIGLTVTVVGSWPIMKDALDSLRARRVSMNVSMSIGILAAISIGEFFTSSLITLVVLISEQLEHLAVSRGMRAVKTLADLLPHTVMVVDEATNQTTSVHLDDLRVGQVIVINQGECVPVDGVVIKGNSYIDESSITGEPMPVLKQPLDSLFAGTMNQSSCIWVRATRVGFDSSFGKILKTIEEAQENKNKSPSQKLADSISAYIVSFAFSAAALTFYLSGDVVSSISVIIVAGACGIAAGTPLAILGGISQCARAGALVKGGQQFEKLTAVDTVIFDKTGTLTYGHLDLVHIQTASPEWSNERLIQLVAQVIDIWLPSSAPLIPSGQVEYSNPHPVAKAVVQLASRAKIEIQLPKFSSYSYSPGKGVECELNGSKILIGNSSMMADRNVQHFSTFRSSLSIATSSDHLILSESYVAVDGRIVGALFFADKLRPEASEVLLNLKKMGIRTILLSGNKAPIAQKIGELIGISEVYGGQMPEDKEKFVSKLVAEGRTVAMIGDGINDAMALSRASVSVAMGSGTDIAKETAEIVLMNNSLAVFTDTIRIAHQCKRVITANLVLTLVFDGVGIVIASAGMLPPVLAALMHGSWDVIAILNSCRVFYYSKKNSSYSSSYQTRTL